LGEIVNQTDFICAKLLLQ